MFCICSSLPAPQSQSTAPCGGLGEQPLRLGFRRLWPASCWGRTGPFTRESAMRLLSAFIALALCGLFTGGAGARCNKNLVEWSPGVMPARFEVAQEKVASAMRVTFVGHASFLIETPQGVRVVTDYNGYNG